MARFGPSEYTDYDEALAHIKQIVTLRVYQKKFERIASRVHDWPEKGTHWGLHWMIESQFGDGSTGVPSEDILRRH